ncbi:hypothetical protein ACKI16_23600 [Streptomyces scabiei]|uniref:hypothetical protein n=1 Tax=Streptomyces scabiei TaxID=1930 RepID=UPI0038F6640E
MPPPARRRRPKSQPPELPEVPGGLLDWRQGGHWSDVRAQCRYCPQLTNLRDIYGRPAHKVCAEGAAYRWAEEQSETYENERKQ